MLTVACVKWGDMYGAGYVNNLHQMLRRSLAGQFRFNCFTDNIAGLDASMRWHNGRLLEIAPRALPGNLIGWWNKLWLFSPGLFPAGSRVLYLDLDTVLLDDITAIAQCTSEFAILRDFYRPRGLGSGVMMWEAGRMTDIWDGFMADGYPDLPGGDQSYIEIAAHRKWGHRLPADCILQNLYPGAFVSYKVECADGPPLGARVVCFHGQPKPHNCGAGWIDRHWRMLSPDPQSSAA